MHDLGYASRITHNFRNVLQLGLADGDELLREVGHLGGEGEDQPLIRVGWP